ncbi:MAG: endonuclease/exonuclease/phosphatase family protein [bacterium]
MTLNLRFQFPRLSFMFLLLFAFLQLNCSGSRYFGTDQSIRVLTYNIHHAEGADGKIDIKRIARVILTSQADIVALQEVDRNTKRSNNIDLLTALADETGMTYAFGKTIDFQGGDYGNGILTKFPILEERNYYLKSVGNGEQRAAMALVLDCKGQDILLINTHLDHRVDDSERFGSVQELIRISKTDSTRPVIVCGDFNDVPASRSIALIHASFDDCWERAGNGNGFTFASDNPQRRIDYIFCSMKLQGQRLRTTLLDPQKATVIQSDASDHLPLVVDFRMGAQ